MKKREGMQISVEEFQAYECNGNLVEWRIIENHYANMHGEPPYFVYRAVQGPGGRVLTEYLLKNGKVSNICADGHFDNWQEIGIALILIHANVKAGGARNFYDNDYWNWLSDQYDISNDQKESTE